jgi:hypothetical protein
MGIKEAMSPRDAQVASIQRIVSETVRDVRCDLNIVDGLVWCTVKVGGALVSVKLELFGGSFTSIQRDAERLADLVARQRCRAGL